MGPASSGLLVVADSLQLAAARELPGDELEAAPQTFTVEEHEELCHHSGGEKTRGPLMGRTVEYFTGENANGGVCLGKFQTNH